MSNSGKGLLKLAVGEVGVSVLEIYTLSVVLNKVFFMILLGLNVLPSAIQVIAVLTLCYIINKAPLKK